MFPESFSLLLRSYSERYFLLFFCLFPAPAKCSSSSSVLSKTNWKHKSCLFLSSKGFSFLSFFVLRDAIPETLWLNACRTYRIMLKAAKQTLFNVNVSVFKLIHRNETHRQFILKGMFLSNIINLFHPGWPLFLGQGEKSEFHLYSWDEESNQSCWNTIKLNVTSFF